MSWVIKWNGSEMDSDDFTIADLGKVEKESGTPWSTANPFRELVVARAFLGVAMRRGGMSDKETAAALDTLTLKTLKNTFEWRSDDGEEEETEELDPSDQPPTSTTPG